VHFTRVDWPWLDHTFFALSAASFLMTLLVIAGTIHAMNLIDGFNGLMLGVSMLMFAAIALVSSFVKDTYVLHLSLLCFGAIGGLFLLNFPFGKVFAGDSGAYFIGFLLGTVVLMLVQRNPQVTAWFPCLLIAYPIFETLFSIYRKVILRKMAAMQPDGVHLHMLVYKRMLKHKSLRRACINNALTSPYLWALSLLGIIPSVIFWRSTVLTMLFCVLFAGAYLKIYWNLVLFKDQLKVFKYVPWFYEDKKLTKETT
jgi:UDP-N-acetylmuramyl pentapeptide phosphotransferase/UDP-N-acetylglucosamine-1-phosphate transferase